MTHQITVNLRVAIPLVILFVLTFTLISPQITPVGSPSDRRPTKEIRFPCATDYVGIIQSGQNADAKPQLSLEQMLWIGTVVRTSSSITAISKHNFLVWGLGHDSHIWNAVHCSSTTRTRTLFIENWRDWIVKIHEQDPELEVVHFDKYDNTSVENAEAFFSQPYLLPLPDQVSNECWNVVLVGRSRFYSFIYSSVYSFCSQMPPKDMHRRIQGVTRQPIGLFTWPSAA